jgi:hypothetical protein
MAERADDDLNRRDFLRLGGAAVCDLRAERTDWAIRAITAGGDPQPSAYTRGPRDFERPCETEGLDEIECMAAGAGHGGMDFIEDYRLIKCLRESVQTDMNVYDAAALSAVVELSIQSNAKRARTLDFPDFTRGRWRTNPKLDIVHV